MTERAANGTTAEGSVARLIKAGLELGVAEAARKVSEHAPRLGRQIKDVTGTTLVWTGAVTKEMGRVLKEDPESITQIVKEVWSRGGPKEKKMAADALGRGLGKVIPYKAVTAARELARMARSPKEADLVGRSVITPILESNPALVERVKGFLEENEDYVRRAALAALLGLAARRKKYVGVVTQGLLIVAEAKEAELRQAVKTGIKQLTATDPAAVAKAVASWTKSEPSKRRLELAKQTVRTAPAAAKAKVERIVFAGLERLANGGSKAKSGGTAKAGKGSKRGRN